MSYNAITTNSVLVETTDGSLNSAPNANENDLKKTLAAGVLAHLNIAIDGQTTQQPRSSTTRKLLDAMLLVVSLCLLALSCVYLVNLSGGSSLGCCGPASCSWSSGAVTPSSIFSSGSPKYFCGVQTSPSAPLSSACEADIANMRAQDCQLVPLEIKSGAQGSLYEVCAEQSGKIDGSAISVTAIVACASVLWFLFPVESSSLRLVRLIPLMFCTAGFMYIIAGGSAGISMYAPVKTKFAHFAFYDGGRHPNTSPAVFSSCGSLNGTTAQMIEVATPGLFPFLAAMVGLASAAFALLCAMCYACITGKDVASAEEDAVIVH